VTRAQAWLVALGPALILQAASAWAWHLGIHEPEELYNAAHAALVLASGPGLILPLQYQPFCGGCAVDAALGAGSFAVLGPSIGAWRMVGWFWFAVAVLSAGSLAERFAGRRGLFACGALFAFAPPAYQELANILNGNHPEGGALLVLQLALGASARGARRPWMALLLQGLLVGFGLYFVRSLVLGVVGLGLCLVLARSASGALAAGAGLVVGLLPLVAVREVFGAWPTEPIYQHDEWRLSLAWVGRNAQTLWAPVQLRGIWGDGSGGSWSWLGVPAFAGWAALAWLGRRATALSGTLFAFTALYLVYRLAVWMDGTTPPFAQQVRYLGLVYPAALGLAAVGLARGGWMVPAGVALALPGVGSRVKALSGPWSAHQRAAPAHAFLAERARGPEAVLLATRAGSPYDLAAVAAGRHDTEPGYFVPYMKDQGLSLLERADLDPSSRRYGRTLGALIGAEASNDQLASAIQAGAELSLPTLDAWLLHDPGLVDDLGRRTEAPSDEQARKVWSLARGRVIGRSCLREDDPDAPEAVSVVLSETCPIALDAHDDLRWVSRGVGTVLGEGDAATLTDLWLDDALDRAAVRQGLDWAREAAWLTERLPEVALRGGTE